MADYFWVRATPIVTQGQYEITYVAARISGLASDGSQDTFAQVPISALIGSDAVMAVLNAALSGMVDINGGEPPSAAGLYIDGGTVKYKGATS